MRGVGPSYGFLLCARTTRHEPPDARDSQVHGAAYDGEQM